MTKIILNSEAAAPVFQVLKTPLSILLYPTVIAYRAAEASIYVTDPYADQTVSRLTEAGIPIEVVKV